MLFQCPRVRADFPAERLHLENRGPARLIWEEHGGTYVVRLEGLEVLEAEAGRDEAGIWLELALPEPGSMVHRIEGFAGRHQLRLPAVPGAEEILATPMLAACHLPGPSLFVYCEEPRLTVRFSGPQTLEASVSGRFKTRRLPCRETDLVIHLDTAGVSRLLAGLLAGCRQSPNAGR